MDLEPESEGDLGLHLLSTATTAPTLIQTFTDPWSHHHLPTIWSLNLMMDRSTFSTTSWSTTWSSFLTNNKSWSRSDLSFRPQPDEDFKAKRARLDQTGNLQLQAESPFNYYNLNLHSDHNVDMTWKLPPQHTAIYTLWNNKPVDDTCFDVSGRSKSMWHHWWGITQLPPGWHHENGFVVMDDSPVMSGRSRATTWSVDTTCSSQLHLSVHEDCQCPMCLLEHLGKDQKHLLRRLQLPWSGGIHKEQAVHLPLDWKQLVSRYCPPYRKIWPWHLLQRASDGYTTLYVEPKSKDKNNLNDERKMSLGWSDLAFTEAKTEGTDFILPTWCMGILWSSRSKTRSSARRPTSYLKWSTNCRRLSHEPRARLITQGFKDPDALAGAIEDKQHQH